MLKAKNLRAAASELTEYWSPKVVGEVDDFFVKVAKVKGTFVWHLHEDEDELFLVLKGQLRLEMRDARGEADGDVELDEGDFFVMPKGVEHLPVAEDECWLALLERKTTKHTGAVVTPLTKSIEEQRS